MPKGPNGERRPADVIGCAVLIGKIATGEVAETGYAAPGRKRSGKAGGRARAKSLMKEQRVSIAKKAARARWT